MTSLWPGGDCDPCERGLHHKCIGWSELGFCGCTKGLCRVRLITGVMWDIYERPGGHVNWRVAEAIKTLQAEVNRQYPDRPKSADGTIGDARHAAEKSDHNPVAPHAGVVTAWDITTAPFTIALAETLRQMGKAGDRRVKYVIYRGRICSSKDNWAWRPYSGYSQHFDHIHLSVSDDPAFYDSTRPWNVFVHAHATVNPTPSQEADMKIVRAPGKPTALLTGTGRLIALKAGEGEVYEKLGIPDTTLTAAEFDHLDAVSHRIP